MPDTLARLKAASADRYTLQRELGRGGMATVYLAEDLKHHRPVALKVLRPELAAALGPDRFLREIELAARLTHPHILPLHDSGNADGFLYYVMPYVEGESLRDRLTREKQLPVDDALQISREVADALSYAHSHGVIHRDIKPENILLESGHAVVADFGIAKAVDAAGGDRLTETGVAMGTPAYMSPEQAGGSKDLDGRSDLYSLGCVLYEMLAGQPPFTGPTVESLIRQHLSAEPPSITNIRPSVPSWVVSALQRALAKTPADRFNPVAQFGEAIAPRVSIVDAAARSVPPRRFLRWLTTGAAAAIVLVAGWFGWHALIPDEARQGPREPPPFTIVAEFEGTADAATRVAVSRLIGAALDQSGIVMALPDEQVGRGLTYAGYTDTTTITSRIAKELAIRGSITTLVVGAVDRLGERYAVTARLVDADSGVVLASGKANAADADELMRAVERAVTDLSRDLASQTAGLGPRRQTRLVMTPSFAAYRKYAMAQRIDVSDKAAARRLLHEAVELDPAFAWAWWSLGIKAAEFRDSSVMFIEEALRHPERLTESERYQIEAGLVWIRDEDYPRTVSLIDRALLIDPSTPIGNKCGALANMGRRQEAAECMDLDEARSPFGRTAIGIRNDVNLLIEVGRIADAERVAAQLQAPRRWQQYFALKIALASANWVRAESLATAYLADPTSEPWVPGRSQLALASVYAARGAIGRADSMLSRTQGAHPFGVAVARSFLVTVTGHRVAPWLTEINDTLPGQLFWRVARNLAGGDTSEARSALDALRGLSPDSHPRAARYARERARFAEALVAAHRGRWDDVIAAARAQLESWVGAELHLFSRWLLAAAYDRQGMKDSAVAYYTKATESSGIDSYELFYVGEPYSFSHFRLGQLLTEMGDADRAKAHWATFLDTFTDPDPEYAWMVMEARTKLEELARGR